MGSAVIYPPSPGFMLHSRESAVKGRNARRILRWPALYGLPRPVSYTHLDVYKRQAVLIDADNASRTAMKDVMAEVAVYGTCLLYTSLLRARRKGPGAHQLRMDHLLHPALRAVPPGQLTIHVQKRGAP